MTKVIKPMKKTAWQIKRISYKVSLRALAMPAPAYSQRVKPPCMHATQQFTYINAHMRKLHAYNIACMHAYKYMH